MQLPAWRTLISRGASPIARAVFQVDPLPSGVEAATLVESGDRTWLERTPSTESATVSLGGVRKPVSMALVDDAAVGDYVLVHVGYALNRISPGSSPGKTLTVTLSTPDSKSTYL